MEKNIAILKEKGIRITPQRLGVYEIITAKNKHLTAEEIYRKMKIRFPAISFATIYSILDLYGRKDLLRERRIISGKSCFDGRMDSHHHFLCKKCGKIFDVDIPPCPVLKSAEFSNVGRSTLKNVHCATRTVLMCPC